MVADQKGALFLFRGPTAGDHVIAITLLGAINTVIAGVLALVRGQGLPDRLYHDKAEYQRLQDWYRPLDYPLCTPCDD